MNKSSIPYIPEDLLDEDQLKQRSKSKVAQTRHVTSKRHQPESSSTLDVLVSETANALGIAIEELHNWTQETVVPKGVIKRALMTANRLKLNPLLGQINWELNIDGSYEIFIPIDGWISLIHRQPTFQGIRFHQSPETEHSIPIWMECTIYRSDLSHPVTVREYYAELKTEHQIWQQVPRRMLRHKTLQQCARLAFGITAPGLKIPLKLPITEKLSAAHTSQNQHDRKALLKQKLNLGKF
jgi:hypothetical protein